MANFVSYEQLKRIVQEIGHNFSQLAGAYTIKGNSTFANLPTPALNYVGFVYNVTDDFTTTSDFVEGAGKSYPAGTNVVIIDATPPHYNAVTPNGDENPKYNGWYETDGNIYFLTSDNEINPNVEKTYYTVSFRSNERAYKYDVIGGTVDLTDINDSIRDILGIIAPEFDESQTYPVGRFVVYNNQLYECRVKHTGDWDNTHFASRTVGEFCEYLKGQMESNENTIQRLSESIAPAFDSATTYNYGDIVERTTSVSPSPTTSITNLRYYKCINPDGHTGEWDGMDFALVKIVDLIADAASVEPNTLTAAEMEELISLL